MTSVADTAASRPPVAGVLATAKLLLATVASQTGALADKAFPLSVDGLESMIDWLKAQHVAKVALLQGNATWPWQVERERRRDVTGPLTLAYWFEYTGVDRLEVLAADTVWQPVMLAMRDIFAVFLIRPESQGGRYRLIVGSDTSHQLATLLAQGRFIEEYPKPALVRLIDAMPTDGAAMVEGIDFFLAESRGHWHNRARAKIARRLKHCDIDLQTRKELVRTISERLIAGNFTEQFDDQLRLMLQLAPETALAVAAEASKAPAQFVRRYGAWLADRSA